MYVAVLTWNEAFSYLVNLCMGRVSAACYLYASVVIL